jgi:putative membrane protein
MAQHLFTQEELDRISEAVRSAEKKTSGEIVPYFVEQSDRYEEAAWRGGALFAALSIVAVAVFHLTSDEWHGLGPAEIGILVLGALGLGVMMTHWISGLKRLLAGDALLEQRVTQRAAQAFIAEEVFHTRDRTGILLFLSRLERKVLVVGDSGINEKVKQSEWEDVVARLTRGINGGKAAAGFVDAIGRCGELLARRGVKRRKGDTDELTNKLRIGTRKGGRRKRS